MRNSRSETKGPNPEKSRRRYKRLVKTYDLWRKPTENLRRDAVAALRLGPGDAVLDIGCGTGFSFAELERYLSTEGKLIGIDLSPDMLAKGREWTEENGWTNVTLLEENIESFDLDEQADAALFFFTHDILQNPQAIKNVLRNVKPGGRIAVGGMKFAQGRKPVRNACVRVLASPYVTTFDGYDRPWLHLAELVPDLQVRQRWAGSSYLAWGTAE